MWRSYTKTKGKKVHTTVYNDGPSISENDIKYSMGQILQG